jgi:ankyrin repeat protein
LILAGAFAAQGGTNMSKAAINSDLTAVKAAVAAGEQVNEEDKWGWTPLLWSVYYDALPVTEYLLAQGANPNCQATRKYNRMKVGCTPLIISGYYGLPDHAGLLLKAGARTDLADGSGYKAMDYAKEYKFKEVVVLLEGAAAGPATPAKAVQPVVPPAQ